MVEAVIKSELSCFSSNPALVRINLNEETGTVNKLKYEHSIDLQKKKSPFVCVSFVTSAIFVVHFFHCSAWQEVQRTNFWVYQSSLLLGFSNNLSLYVYFLTG